MSKTFFLDFDGTITKNDVVATMVIKFCRPGWEELNNQWERGELSTEDCANKTFALFDATMEDIYRLLDTIELDNFFVDFVRVCKAGSYPIYILSDGYDILIQYILNRHGLSGLPVYANKLVTGSKGFSIACTYKNPHCQKCGTCKKNLLHHLKGQNTQTVYVGDGCSDTCVCHEADIVFAKGSLLRYCHKNNVKALAYTSFQDIINWLNKNS
ncbi:2,3-diketo-5-methylthio-1-phosphopentane phosphatase [Desulfohalotomaculum tongense]|uniref:MtnX-like HAD-IB family phosphatase n=1 Tax=Desulforadius tongensis TaxID=1216062 RepID=UPI00195EC740|nr:MtnX-like HAD-IB family phosphatase [Desulforadius tongensis]MBM7853964.1 2,3-diketo-5-methylthio-1-phosphopentane phosphatase [Desulforadius tongensis]